MTTQTRGDREIKTRTDATPTGNGELAPNEPGDETQRIAAAFAAPFAPHDVHWKPQAVSGNRALAVPYVDARAIMDRLDAVVGIDGWQDEYQLLPDGSVVCKLRVRIGDWVEKTDIGGQSEQKDEHDKHKAAFSDALKRAAVKFAIGRYLYRVPKQWCDYDAKKRAFITLPMLPPEALRVTPASPPGQTTNRGGTTPEPNGTKAQVSREVAFLIKEQTEKLGWQPGRLRNHLRGKFNVEFVRDLTTEQAAVFRGELEKLANERGDVKR